MKQLADSIVILLIGFFFYTHTTVTLKGTDNIILIEIVKLSATILMTYITWYGLLEPIAKLIWKFIAK